MRASGGTLTVLFTDLVESTAVANRLGDETAQALRRAHDRILRQQFESHGGTVVKGTGDGFLVTFSTARQGVACARAVQRAIAEQQAEGRYLDLGVRIGVHTGEPSAEDGDVFGIDVTLAARLMAEAQGGEIIVSEVTHLLVRQHAFEMQPAGELTLKGFPEAVPAYRVLWTEESVLHRRLSRFVGRHDEQIRLGACLDALLEGRQGSLALIAGEPGVGKTRLATELSVIAQDRGARVLTGRAYESEGLPPYFPFADALGQFLRARPPGELARIIAGDGAYVVRMLPELRSAVSTTEPAALSPEAERYLLFEAACNLLARLAEEAPLVLLLDDLHWADHASVHLLQHLARRIANAAVLVIATYREVELGDGHPLSDLVAEIARRGPGECFALQPLSRDDTAELVEDVLGERPAAGIADALYAKAEGNPFFTEELVRNIREHAPAEVELPARPAGTTVPEGVRQVVLQRVGLLSEAANSLLVRCAVLGHELTLGRIGAVVQLEEDALLELIEQTLDARALREAGDGLAFAHPLIRETLYQGLPGPRRRLLHGQVGDALEQLYGAAVELHLPELAHHFLEAATDPASAAKALDYARRAATQAMDVFAYEDAVVFYRHALDTLERLGTSDRAARCDLLLALGDAQRRAGDGAGAEEAFRQAAAIAEVGGLADQLARSAIGYHIVRGVTGTVDEFFIHLVGEACRVLPEVDSPLRARLLAVRSSALYHVEPHEGLAALSEEALAMARRLEDPPTLVWVLGVTHSYRHPPGDVIGRLDSASELLRLAELHGPREMTLLARRFKIVELLQLGEIRALDIELEVLERDANELRLPFYLWLVAVCRAMRALLNGELREAERLAQHAYTIGQEVQRNSGLAYQFLAIQLFALRREQGRLNELLPVVQSFVEQYPALRWRVGVAYVYCDLGRLEEGRYEFEHLAADNFAELPLDFNWLISATILAEVCAKLKDAKRATLLYDLLLPYADRAAVIGDQAACNGSVSRYLGLLAATMRNWDGAEGHFVAAIEMNQRMGARSFVAHTQQEFAKVLLARSGPGDPERARSCLTDACAVATELGMSRLLEEIDELRKLEGA